jgi:hypothetical protein
MQADQPKFNVLAPAQYPPEDFEEQAEGAPGPNADSGKVVDVLCLNTARARDCVGGVAGIESAIRRAVADANDALSRSGLVGEDELKVNLVKRSCWRTTRTVLPSVLI